MNNVTEILGAIRDGDPHAVDELLPMVYEHLRQLARKRIAQEQPGQTLQATALVHEAFVRITGQSDVEWNGADHFFGAAAEAMRRILIDRARKRRTQKHGGEFDRIEFDSQMLAASDDERLVQLDQALDQLQQYDPRKAEGVKLRFFAGLTNRETAALLGISPATADRDWIFARAWLRSKMA